VKVTDTKQEAVRPTKSTSRLQLTTIT